MSILKKILSAYLVDYPRVISYMLQQTEYDVRSYLAWWGRTRKFGDVMKRGDYVSTKNSRLLRGGVVLTTILYFIVNMLTIIALRDIWWLVICVVLGSIMLYPMVVVVITTMAVTVMNPLHHRTIARRVERAKQKLSSHKGIVIAVAGSYGKTSMKELLQHLLDGSVSYSATEGNKNTLMSQVGFIETLDGSEEVLIVEMGEGEPGDIPKMVDLLAPDYAVITGLAPNHLDKYKSIDAVVKDFSSLADFVGPQRTYINADSDELKVRLEKKSSTYSMSGFDGWHTDRVEVGVQSISFTAEKGDESLEINARLLGRHNIGPLLLASVLSLQLGTHKAKLLERIGTIEPYEHRMQPRDMAGAWMIDDTYNGNIEGMRAGLVYLKEVIVAGKKYYVTPGLVEQGPMTERVHSELGKAIADANPDGVYLMANSTTKIIEDALVGAGYGNKVTIINNPLDFYTNIHDVVASGDIILCQNDWSDSYA